MCWMVPFQNGLTCASNGGILPKLRHAITTLKQASGASQPRLCFCHGYQLSRLSASHIDGRRASPTKVCVTESRDL